MPPVLGPVSPSKARLWSWAEASGRTVVPSLRAKKLASSPARHSSITTSAPAAPKAPAKQARHGGEGLLDGRGNRHALARGKAVGLDHDRRAVVPDVRGRGVGIAEPGVGGGRDMRLGSQILGEALGRFESGRGAARAEDGDAGRGEVVCNPGGQRALRSDDHQVDRGPRQKPTTRGMIGDVDGDQFGVAGDPGLPGAA